MLQQIYFESSSQSSVEQPSSLFQQVLTSQLGPSQQIPPKSNSVRVLGKIGEGLTSNVYLVVRQEIEMIVSEQAQMSGNSNEKRGRAETQDYPMTQESQQHKRSLRILSNISAHSNLTHQEEDSHMNNSFEEEYDCASSLQQESAIFNVDIEEIKSGFEIQSVYMPQPTNKLYALKVFNKDAKGRQFGINEENIITKIQQTSVERFETSAAPRQSQNIVRLVSTHKATKINQGGSRSMMRRSNVTNQGMNQDPNSLSKQLAVPVMDQELDLDHAPFDCMLFEYCPHSDLFELIKQLSISEGGAKPFIAGQHLTKFIIKQLFTSLMKLHEEVGIAHLDIKLENILIDQNFDVKICDFGFSDDVRTRQHQEKGTEGYKAPEIMSRQSSGYDPQQADIFALGVTLFTLVFGVPPFLNATMQDTYYREFYQAKDQSSVPRFVRVHPATKSLNSLFDGSCSASDQIQQSRTSQFYSELLEMFFVLLTPNPQRRPKSAREVLERFTFLQTQSEDICQEEARYQLKGLFDKYVKPIIQESQQLLLQQI